MTKLKELLILVSKDNQFTYAHTITHGAVIKAHALLHYNVLHNAISTRITENQGSGTIP